jgi:chromosome segregation ATPase
MDLNAMVDVPGGASGAFGAILAAIGGAIWLVRKVWRTDRVEGARSQAETDIIERLQDLLDKANARADLAEQRADTAYKERNDLLREIGDLKRTIAELTAEVRHLKEKLDEKGS